MTNESKEHESLPCPHARASWKNCPHCLGINKSSPPKMSLEEFVNAPEEVQRPILEEAVRKTDEEQRRVMEESKEQLLQAKELVEATECHDEYCECAEHPRCYDSVIDKITNLAFSRGKAETLKKAEDLIGRVMMTYPDHPHHEGECSLKYQCDFEALNNILLKLEELKK